MVPPFRMRWVASAMADSITEFPETFETVSMASMRGMPALRSTESVRQVRAMMDFRMRDPKRGILSLRVSKKRWPTGVWDTAEKSTPSRSIPRITTSR